MKNIILSLFIGLAAFFTACNPIEDRYELGPKTPADKIDVTVTSVDGSNMLILKNNTPEYGGAWDYKFGITTKMIDTVVVPVLGTYDITYIATTDGGLVEKNIPVTIDDMSHYVPGYYELTDAGKGKTWVYDKNENGAGFCYMTSPKNWKGFWWDPADGCCTYPDENAAIRFEIDGANTICKFIPEEGDEIVGSFLLDMNNMTLTIIDTHIPDYNHPWTDPAVVATGKYQVKVLDDNSLVLFQVHGTGWVWKFRPKDQAGPK